MFGSRKAWRRIACLLGGLCLGGALSLPGELRAEAAAPPSQTNGNDNKKPGLGVALPPQLSGVPVLDLASCKAIALSKQPAIGAAQASYQAALARQRGLDTICVPRFLARDLPIRKTQAAVGVSAAQLEIQRVQLDAVYAVTFGYLSAQYAAEQHALLDSSRTRLVELKDGVKAGLDAGKTNIREEDLPRVDVYLGIVDGRIEESVQGEQRAMSALREALAADPHSPLVLRATGLFRLEPDLSKDQLVADALARRPEVQQATLLSQTHALEVEAQGMKRLFPTSPTFASGSDIHSRPLPAGSYDEQYKPAALGPEMPVTINGDCGARAEIARAYEQRSGSLLEKTRNLIVLETEQAYFRYLEARRKLPVLQEAARKAQEVFDATDKSFKAGRREVAVRDWLQAGSQVTEVKSQVNQVRYQLLVALAGLERATACGYQPGFELAPTTDPPEQKRKEKKENDKEKIDSPKGGKPGKGAEDSANRPGPNL
jgi:outer membrane protein TolC